MELVELAPDPEAIRATTGTSQRRSRVGSGRDQKSAVTNGKRLHVVPPGDTAWSRRFRDVLAQILADITPPDGLLSEGQRQLARRAATLCIVCEQQEGIAAAGEAIDLETYGKLSDRLGRVFQRLGLKRIASGNGPSLGDVLLAGIERDRRHADR
jgi:hypothetical protein